MRLLRVASVILAVILAVFTAHASSRKENPDVHPSDYRFYRGLDSFRGEKFMNPSGIFYDKKNNELYVTDRDLHGVYIFDDSWTLVFDFGKKSGVSEPLDVAARGSKIYVSQQGKHYLEIFNLRGVSVGSIAPDGEKNFSPGQLDVDSDGNLFVLDNNSGVCYMVDGTDKIVSVINKDRRVSGAAGLAAGSEEVYLFTPFNGANAINVFDKKGVLLYQFEGIVGRNGTLNIPAGGKVDELGRLWMVDSGAGVVVFDMQRRPPSKIAVIGRIGREGEVLFFPIDIDLTAHGMLYILEKERKRISVFK